MSGQAPYGYQLEPTVVEGIRTKKMVADPVAADHVRLMFEMYAEPETSFGDITRYFEEHDIKIYGKSMFRTFLSQLLSCLLYTSHWPLRICPACFCRLCWECLQRHCFSMNTKMTR